MDFISDTLVDGRKVRILNVIDDCNREALIVAAMSWMKDYNYNHPHKSLDNKLPVEFMPRFDEEF